MSKPRDVARILGRTEAANPNNLALSLEGVGGITQYDSVGLLPVTDLTNGDQAFVVSNSRIYISNGSGWYNATVANATPFWDSGYTPASTYEITDSATPLTVTTRASDSDADNITYSIVSEDSAQYAFVTTQDSGVWTFTPLSADSANANAAAGLLRDSNSTAINVSFRATDGINVLSAPSIITYQWGTSGIDAGTGDTPTQQTGNNGTVFYYGPSSDTEDSDFFMNLNVTAGSTIGIGLIGGGGGGHHNNNAGKTAGSGAYFVGRVVVPNGISAMTIYSGGRGDYYYPNARNAIAVGGSYGGGRSGIAAMDHAPGNGVGAYGKAASGGGYSGLFTGTSNTGGVFANAVVVVGGGGASGGIAAGQGGYGGAAGASGGVSGTGGGSPGTVSAGGAGGIRAGYGLSGGQGYIEGIAGGVAGSALQGGRGQGSQYEAGGGGGGGYYGGGGGRGGGGYDAGPGGGGSGYKLASGITVDYNDGGNAGTLTAFQNAVRSASGASDFTMPTGTWGAGGAPETDGKSGFALVWLPV